MTDVINFILSILVLITQIGIVFILFLLVVDKNKRSRIIKYIIDKALFLSLVIATVATLGSLYYSEIASFNPCNLCWFQRIFMYPLVVILGFGAYRGDDKVVDYSLALAGIGALISTYHNYIYYTTSIASPSGICASGVSCIQRYVVGFEYLTLPLMALTAFIAIIIILLMRKYRQKRLG